MSVDEPGQLCQEHTGSPAGCDTELTPAAKDGEAQGWRLMAGARFGSHIAIPGSATPPNVDLFSAAFRDEAEGFFAGAECGNQKTPFDGLGSCQRFPAIYQHSRPHGQTARVVEALGPRASAEDRPGYIASVAWIDRDRAIAVGGSGHYPRRELARAPGESDEVYAARDLAGEELNAAGRARVWTYEAGVWSELRDLPETQDGRPMGGLTTVDCSPRALDGELCIAGGLRQLWVWRGGRFAEGFMPTSTDVNGRPTVQEGPGWRFRVRQVAFAPGASVRRGQPQTVAVTSGCCSGTDAENIASLLLFDGTTWRVRPLADDALGPVSSSQRRSIRSRQTVPDSYFSVLLAGEGNSILATSGGDEGQIPGLAPSRLVSFKFSSGSDVASATSRVANGCVTNMPAGGGYAADPVTGHLCGEALNPSLTSARLVAGAGDLAGAPDSLDSLSATGKMPPDGLMDWAVGTLERTGQAIAYTTLARGTFAPNPLDCAVSEANRGCRPRDPGDTAEQTRSRSLFRLPVYALNGLTFTADGTGWAVGDKGAILRLGGEGTVSQELPEPPPPRLGARKPRSLPDSSAYGGLAGDESTAVGSVPSLGGQPRQRLPSPRLIPAGTPDASRSGRLPDPQVSSIVMSRDGNEGWAVGRGASRDAPGALYRYDGNRWRLCDPVGVPGRMPPSPACASLRGLQLNDNASGAPMPVQLITAARVPLERDADPTNDDEFELVALGTAYLTPDAGTPRRAVLRYRAGRWSVDERAMRGLGTPADVPFQNVVFTTPDDGWATAGDRLETQLFHFDGRTWIECGKSGAECGDDASVLPLGSTAGRLFLRAAGRRVYLAGTRAGPGGQTSHPFIVRKRAGEPWRAEHDPGCASRDAAGACVASTDRSDEGAIQAFSVAQDGHGRYFGWAVGLFGRSPTDSPSTSDPARRLGAGSRAALLRLAPDSPDGHWAPFSAGDAADDYLFLDAALAGSDPATTGSAGLPKLRTAPGADGTERAVLTPPQHPVTGNALHPALTFDARAGRWRVLPTPFALSARLGSAARQRQIAANIQMLAPDGRGGFWIAAGRAEAPGGARGRGVFFYHYTDEAPRPLFDEAAHPIREQIRAISGAPGGRLWAATDTGTVYRYDRIAGWDRVSIPGWDPARLVTRASAANALAVGPDGEGVVVGEGGRIADIGSGGVRLDAAAGAALCSASPSSPCGTGRDLNAAAVAPDGSAIVAGEGAALLWRPAGGEFRAIRKPETAPGRSFTGASMPTADHAWLTTDSGELFTGELHEGEWTWRPDAQGPDGEPINLDAGGNRIPLTAISLGPSGRGYAVGRQGLVLERTADPAQPWRRLDSGVTEDLYSVTVAPDGGRSALFGGELGLILTLDAGKVEVARPGEFTDPITASATSDSSARIVGLALLPGDSDGEVEAWAASQVPTAGGASRQPPPGALLHFASSDDPLLDPAARAEPLPDATTGRADDLSFAAFGRSDCHFEGISCVEPHGTTFSNEAVSERIVEELRRSSKLPGASEFALFTGDVNHAAGRDDASDTPLSLDVIHRRWEELVRDPLASSGLPVFGAIGGQDLSQLQSCSATCVASRRLAGGAGTTQLWREAFSGMPAPWGSASQTKRGDLSFDPVAVPAAGTARELPGGGARTHYALDLKRDGGSLARLVVLDNSLRSLQASDSNQNPIEPQAKWLDEVLSSRPPGARAIVLANTPSYSFNLEASGGGAETATDAAAFEQTLLENGVDVVLAGRLGWNGVYWTLAPGLHRPCPGEAPVDPGAPPHGPAYRCGELPAGADSLRETTGSASSELASGAGVTGALPTIVASGAGGTFGPLNQPADGAATHGFWHGYSLVHLDPETGRVSVEQRPVLDWIGMRASTHVVRPRQTVAIHGFGREVAGAETPLRYDEISNAAITHRFDLLAADPQRPWLPLVDGDSDAPHHYVPLEARWGSAAAGAAAPSIDRQSGEIRAGDGPRERTYALATLSVGPRVATWPLVFEPHPRTAVIKPPAPPGAPETPAPSTPRAGLAAPNASGANVPPGRLPPGALDTSGLPAPPALPEPLPAPNLDRLPAQPASEAVPSSTPLPPPAPPVQPAAPGGGRREARQTEGAVERAVLEVETEWDDEEGVDPSDAHGAINPMDSPERAFEAKRLEGDRRGLAFTSLERSGQPSAWARDLQWGGGLMLTALVLALGWSTMRPGPGRRQAEQPAPAWARRRS